MLKEEMKSTFCETTFNLKEFEKTLKICEGLIEQQLLPWENLIKDAGADFKSGDVILLNKEVFKDISIPYKFKDNIFKAPYLKHVAYLMKKPPSIYPSIKNNTIIKPFLTFRGVRMYFDPDVSKKYYYLQ